MQARLLMLLAALAAFLAAAFTDSTSARRAADRLILKGGRELVGRLEGTKDHRVQFADEKRGSIELPRTHVRTVVQAGVDPGIYAPLWLDEPAGTPPDNYVRYEPPADGQSGTLSTGVARFFHAPTRTTLFLVGAVHIGEPDYYARLQDVLDSCDLVLFEGVGRGKEGGPPPEEEIARYDALFKIQVKLKDVLGLTFQKDGLDYERDFWKNADVNMESLSEKMAEEGIGLPTDSPLVRGLLALGMGALDMATKGDDSLLRRQLRQQVAGVLAMADKLGGAALGDLNRVLIDWRNDAALAVLDREIEAGPPGRWIGVFYGAGHLLDLGAKLVARGCEFEAADWIVAWRVE